MESKVCPLSLTPAFSVLLGIVAALFANDVGCSFYLSVCAGGLVSSAWVFCGTKKFLKNWHCVFFLTIFFVVTLSSVSLYRINAKTNFPDSIACKGTVRSVRNWGENRCALLISTKYGKTVAYVDQHKIPENGAKIWLSAAVFDFNKASEDGAFDEDKYWKAKGAIKKCMVLDIQVIGKPNIFYRFRNFLDKRIKDTLPKKCAQYMAAITLGEKSRELFLLHKESGTGHLLAVSGFHVGIFAGIGYFLFRKKKHKIVLISLMVWAYVLLSGCAPGALRAAFMLQFALISLLFGAPVTSFNSVSLAGIILLLINPFCYYDIAFRLSLLAALFITSCTGSFSLVSSALVSMLVWFVTAAQCAFSFKRLPAAGLFMNIIAVPVFALLFPLLVVCSLPALLGLPFCGIFTAFCEYLLEGWEIFSEIFTRLIPWNFTWSAVMNVVSAFVFFFFAAEISGFNKNLRIFIAIVTSLVLVLSLYL